MGQEFVQSIIPFTILVHLIVNFILKIQVLLTTYTKFEIIFQTQTRFYLGEIDEPIFPIHGANQSSQVLLVFFPLFCFMMISSSPLEQQYRFFRSGALKFFCSYVRSILSIVLHSMYRYYMHRDQRPLKKLLDG